MKMSNTSLNARWLVAHIIQSGVMPIWDIDHVLLNADHRIKLFDQNDVDNGLVNADQIGALDLDHYRANTVADQVQMDKNLPMLEAVHMLNRNNIQYLVSTARVICEHTRALLADREIKPALLMARHGDTDSRRDHVLKVDNIRSHYSDFSNLLLIDDNLGNCQAFRNLGANATQVIAV